MSTVLKYKGDDGNWYPFTGDVPAPTASIVVKGNVTGVADGTLNLFNTGAPYVAGTLQASINGLPQWTMVNEIDPLTGAFGFDTPPPAGAKINVYFHVANTGLGNADTVDNFNANAVPTPNNLVPLDSNAKLPEAAAPQRHFIQTVLSATQNVGPGNYIINFNQTDIIEGTKLTRSGSGIVIGAGVSVVRVSYTLMAQDAAGAAYIFSRIGKNGANVSQAIDQNASPHKSTSESKLLSVASGDVITIMADSGGGTFNLPPARFSFMSVEVMK